jgi:hypothetical protein
MEGSPTTSFCLGSLIHRPADDFMREDVEAQREVQLAFLGVDTGEIRDPFLIGMFGAELVLQGLGQSGRHAADDDIRQPIRAGASAERRICGCTVIAPKRREHDSQLRDDFKRCTRPTPRLAQRQSAGGIAPGQQAYQ